MAVLGSSSSQSTSTSTTSPAYPEYATQAAGYVSDSVAQAKSAVADKLARVQNFIDQLNRMKALAQQKAQSLGARGGSQQMNPLSAYRAITDLMDQAGIPYDQAVAQQIVTQNSFDDILTTFQQQAASIMANLAAIQKSSSSSQSTSQSTQGSMGLGGGTRSAGSINPSGSTKTLAQTNAADARISDYIRNSTFGTTGTSNMADSLSASSGGADWQLGIPAEMGGGDLYASQQAQAMPFTDTSLSLANSVPSFGDSLSSPDMSLATNYTGNTGLDLNSYIGNQMNLAWGLGTDSGNQGSNYLDQSQSVSFGDEYETYAGD